MSEILTFMGEHPILTFLLAAMACGVIKALIWLPFKMLNRVVRMRNIAAHGWPPAHCDADGDFKPQQESAA